MAYSCLDNRSGAHIAGFESYVEIAVGKPPASGLAAGLADCDEFGVERHVVLGLAQVVAARKDASVLDNDTADGCLFKCGGFFGFFERFFYESFVNISREHENTIAFFGV